MKNSLLFVAALFLTIACSDSKNDGGAAPKAMVGLWAHQDAYNALNKTNLTCADFNNLKSIDENGTTVIELSVIRIDANGAAYESSSLTKNSDLVFLRFGTINAAGSLSLTGEALKAMNEDLQPIKDAGGQIQLTNIFTTSEDGSELVLTSTAKVTFDGEAVDIPEEKITAVSISQAQLDAAAAFARTCL